MAVCVCVSGVGGEVIVNIIFRASIVMAKKKKTTINKILNKSGRAIHKFDTEECHTLFYILITLAILWRREKGETRRSV